MNRALLCEEEAREYVGGIPERTFKTLCGDHVIRLGKRNYCRPSDLDEADRVLDDAADKVERLSRWVLVANSRVNAVNAVNAGRRHRHGTLRSRRKSRESNKTIVKETGNECSI